MEKYAIYHGNKKIGKLYHSKNGSNRVEFIEGLTLHNIPIMFYFPYRDKGQRVFEGAEVEEWIESRGFDRGRMNLTEILMELGMKEYDPWEIFKIFHGKSVHDKYWVTEINLEEKKK